jgi:hypothetical protein
MTHGELALAKNNLWQPGIATGCQADEQIGSNNDPV